MAASGNGEIAPMRAPSSVCSLVQKRREGRCRPFAFRQGACRYLLGSKELLMEPELVSPHRSAISSLDVDDKMGRFVLAGSADATVSVYDLSQWGSEKFARQSMHPNSRKRFRPVARSIRVPAGVDADDPNNSHNLEVPSGHSASLTHVQWYPVDTGAFLSCASDGCLLLWDTNRMKPVLRVLPFAESLEEPVGSAWGSAHLQTGGDHSLIATGSWYDSSVKLVDIRSGTSSHQLTGHAQGITAVQWSPTMPLIVASGSRDGSIRLWDIRKSGSQACLTVFDRDLIPSRDGTNEFSYQGDYSHLRKYARARRKQSKKRKRRPKDMVDGTAVVAPNNYSQLQNQGTLRSHRGHVGALSFLPGGQTLASVGGADGELLLWDLRHGPTLMESKFVAPGGLLAATPKRRRAALCVDSNQTIWVGHLGRILGFSLEGGSPTQVLRGHLNNVTSLDHIHSDKYLVSGSQDGMLLAWGKPKGALFHSRRPVLTHDQDSW